MIFRYIVEALLLILVSLLITESISFACTGVLPKASSAGNLIKSGGGREL